MSELDLMKDARPDEVFYLAPLDTQRVVILRYPWWGLGLLRQVQWTKMFLPDGSYDGWFTSWTFRLWPAPGDHFFSIQFYRGNTKIDGTRTFMLRYGQLGGQESNWTGVVMTQTPKELLAFRFKHVDEVPVWNNMGGC